MKRNICIFVYGTLRQGYWNHALLSRAEFVGQGKTVKPEFVMRAVSYPFISDPTPEDQEFATQIVGELYMVSEKEMKELDRLEGYPTFYDRRQIEVLCSATKKPITAWVYINNRPSGDIIPSGDYADFKEFSRVSA